MRGQNRNIQKKPIKSYRVGPIENSLLLTIDLIPPFPTFFEVTDSDSMLGKAELLGTFHRPRRLPSPNKLRWSRVRQQAGVVSELKKLMMESFR
jgi:hypothetical protein